MFTRRQMMLGSLLTLPAMAQKYVAPEVTEEYKEAVNAQVFVDMSDRKRASWVAGSLFVLHNVPEVYHELVRQEGGSVIISQELRVPSSIEGYEQINTELGESRLRDVHYVSGLRTLIEKVGHAGLIADAFGGMVSHLAATSDRLLSHDEEFIRVLADDRELNGGFGLRVDRLSRFREQFPGTTYNQENSETWSKEEQNLEASFRGAFNRTYNPEMTYKGKDFAEKHSGLVEYFGRLEKQLAERV